MSSESVPPWARERDELLAEASTVADGEVLEFCTDCGTSHRATRTADGYEGDCPDR